MFGRALLETHRYEFENNIKVGLEKDCEYLK
jgi:hypothetical protein